METTDLIDRQARERAEGWITELGQKIGEAESLLSTLQGFVGGDSLPAGAVASAGRHAEAIRDQLPILRQAVRDLEEVPAAA
jgi:hypothetical protein